MLHEVAASVLLAPIALTRPDVRRNLPHMTLLKLPITHTHQPTSAAPPPSSFLRAVGKPQLGVDHASKEMMAESLANIKAVMPRCRRGARERRR